MPDPQPDPDAAWWTLALDPAARAANARLDPAAPGPDYGGYLLLDRLLGAQAPVSSVPDERVFILTHQLFELVFKGMIFDVGVIARTFEALLALDANDFIPLALESAPDDRGPAAFWRPAMTAAARLRHAARAILPPVMQLLGRGEGDDVLFSTLEFGYFRALLEPSSGFQTAQLRLIQRALGKTPLLHVRVFPGERYGADAEAGGCPVEHVALGDPFVLRAEHARAFPDADGPAARAAALDALAHAVLAQLPASGEAPTAVPLILAGDVDRAAERFRAML